MLSMVEQLFVTRPRFKFFQGSSIPMSSAPSVVLICHDGDAIDLDGLTAWLASSMRLVGVVVIAPSWRRTWRAIQRQIRRGGVRDFVDVLALRAYYRCAVAAKDDQWRADEIRRLRSTYPAPTGDVPRVRVADPNGQEARDFLTRLRPDVVIARCKVLLTPETFGIARIGTFALHPGICPEYRNAHGCFWALTRRDHGRVGMTLLRIDRGVDTGPIFLRATCDYDELRDSHLVIQYRAVTANLDAIADTLTRLARGDAAPLVDDGPRTSAVWGQPTLSAYRRWKAAARRDRNHAAHLPAVS